jgi:uncharacterized protein YndB with AHSA1/START domain
MRFKTSLGPTLALAAMLLPAARAEVIDAAAGGFVVRIEHTVVAPRATVWRLLTGHVSEWWDGNHTYSGSAANMYIEPRPLGCFCETLGEGGAVVHMTVTMINPGKILRLTGGLGPIGLMGADGNMVFSLVDDGDNTQLSVEYRVGGYHPEGFESVAEAVDGVLTEQVQRLVRLVEAGSPQALPRPADPAPPAATPAEVPGNDAQPAPAALVPAESDRA